MNKIFLIAGILMSVSVSIAGAQTSAKETYLNRQASIYKAMRRGGLNPGDVKRIKGERRMIRSEEKYAEIHCAFLPGEKRFLQIEHNRTNRHPARTGHYPFSNTLMGQRR